VLVDPHLLAQAAHGKRRHGKANVMLSHSLASSADVGPAPVVLAEIRQELLEIAAAIQRLGMELHARCQEDLAVCVAEMVYRALRFRGFTGLRSRLHRKPLLA
jgi:hypothetical protein